MVLVFINHPGATEKEGEEKSKIISDSLSIHAYVQNSATQILVISCIISSCMNDNITPLPGIQLFRLNLSSLGWCEDKLLNYERLLIRHDTATSVFSC